MPGQVGAFTADMAALFAERCRGFGTDVEFGAVLRGVLALVRTHRVTLEANYMTLVMNVLCLEGMAKELLPEYNVLDAAKPLLATHKRMPRLAFRAAMPAVRAVKKLRDAVWLTTSEAARGRALRQAQKRLRKEAKQAKAETALVPSGVSV